MAPKGPEVIEDPNLASKLMESTNAGSVRGTIEIRADDVLNETPSEKFGASMIPIPRT